MRYLIALILFSFYACSSNSSKEVQLDTPVSGSIHIAVDETIRPLAEAEIDVFTTTYPHTELIPHFVDEVSAKNLLLQDSVRLIIAASKPDTSLVAGLSQQKITTRSIKIAFDGVAIIVHKQNQDTLFDHFELKDVLTGKLNNWTQIPQSKLNGNINVVFDNAGSSTVRYMKEKLGIDTFSKNTYAQKSNEEVIRYVEQNPNAIGLIGLNWLSDKDDSLQNAFMKSIKVCGYQDETQTKFYKPYQANLADSSYALIREVYIISREARSGLGSGFTTFVANNIGQRIIQKLGLMPATVPVRFVEIKN
jgi:phosphate transport system substrate-binding protein